MAPWGEGHARRGQRLLVSVTLTRPLTSLRRAIRLVIRQVAEERRRYQHVRRAAIARDRNIVEDRESKQRLDVDVVRLRRQRIPKEDDDVDLFLSDERSDLRVAAKRARQEHGDRKIQLLGDGSARRRSRKDFALSERAAVERRPRGHLVLARIVSDERNARPPVVARMIVLLFCHRVSFEMQTALTLLQTRQRL